MSNVATKAKKPNLSVKSVLNWILDHAMIIVIVLLALYVQTQRDAFLKPASLINIISLTAARLPMALGVARLYHSGRYGLDRRPRGWLDRFRGGHPAPACGRCQSRAGRRSPCQHRAGAAARYAHRRMCWSDQRLRHGEIQGSPLHHHVGHADDRLRYLPDGFQLGAGRFLRLQLHHQLRHQAPVPNSNRAFAPTALPSSP